MQRAVEILAVAERFITAWNVADADALREVYSEDARIWHNTSGQFQSVEDNIKSMLWIHRKLGNVNFDVQRREVIPGGFLQQQFLRGILISGEKFAMPACLICKVDNGRITSLEEYIDKAQMRPLTV